MNTSAPKARLVDALSGEKAPNAYFKALSEADNLCAELDTLRELQCRVDELKSEHDAWKDYATKAHNDRAEVLRELASTRAERDDLAERLTSSGNAHEITLGFLADAKREKRAAIAERDDLAGQLAKADAQLKRMQATR